MISLLVVTMTWCIFLKLLKKITCNVHEYEQLKTDVNDEEQRRPASVFVGRHHHIRKAEGQKHDQSKTLKNQHEITNKSSLYKSWCHQQMPQQKRLHVHKISKKHFTGIQYQQTLRRTASGSYLAVVIRI